jgi:hypothetical protein
MSGMLGQWRGDGGLRRWAVGLALLTLLLQGLTPAGFMLARQDGRATIAICTGHGPATSVIDVAGHPSKPAKSQPDTPCAFAGHGMVTATPIAARLATPIAAPITPAAPPRFDLAPGRGLAAPPPPSQGPPTLSI